VTERRRRLVLWLGSACLAAAFFFIGHGASRKGAPVAFLHPPGAENTVRLKGHVPIPGIYGFPDNTDLATVIKMTAPLLTGKVRDKELLEALLKNGDIIEVVAKDQEYVEIIITKMKAKERMVLGIPLHPDQMDLADWESLPGIGPGLAKNIMDHRQKHGDFGSIESLHRVPGIGEKKLKLIRMYFKEL
jgi:competence protein ComEA